MNLLNNGIGYVLFKESAFKATYVDKTMMVDTFYRYVKFFNKYVCVTRPRRFGKSVAANMIAVFLIKVQAKRAGHSLKSAGLARLSQIRNRHLQQLLRDMKPITCAGRFKAVSM